MTKFSCLFLCITIVFSADSCSKDDDNLQTRAPQTGLVAHYPLNGNAIDEINGNDGSLSGVLATTGHWDNEDGGVYFSGTGEYIEIPHNEMIDFGYQEDFTISVWARFNEQANTNVTTNSMISKWCSVTQGCNNESAPFGLRVHNQSSDTPGAFLAIRRNTRATSLCEEDNWFGTPSVFSYDKYHHVVYIKEGSILKIYVDGQLSVQETDVITNDCPIRNEAPLLLGVKLKSTSGSSLAFQGSLDELYIYDRALDEGEIEKLYLLEE